MSGIAWGRESVLGLLPLINCSPANGCARCCVRPSAVLVQNYEAERIAVYLGVPVREFTATLMPQGEHWALQTPCRFRSRRECSIWPVRPVVCKYFPLQRITFEGNAVVAVATEWCRAGAPCIAQLEKWMRGAK